MFCVSHLLSLCVACALCDLLCPNQNSPICCWFFFCRERRYQTTTRWRGKCFFFISWHLLRKKNYIWKNRASFVEPDLFCQLRTVCLCSWRTATTSATIDQLQVEKSSVSFFKTIVFNAVIPNIILSRLSDEQKCIFFGSKVGRFWNGLWLVNLTVK